MTKIKLLSRFIVVILLCAFLIISVGRVTRVFALAEIAPDVAPVFDTQIYQIQDYIDNGMTDPQYEIFQIMLGMLALSQSGSQDYKLDDPYQNEDGVWAWLKSMGIKTYNSLISLIPDTARIPITGDIYSTVPFKQASSAYVSLVMGIANEAKKYTTVQEFKDRVAQGSYYLPWNFDIQKGMNSIFGIYGGIYEWQFDSQPFQTTVPYKTTSIPAASNYYSYYSELVPPIVRHNDSGDSSKNEVYAGQNFSTYCNLFLNPETYKYSIVNDSGQRFPSTDFFVQYLYYSTNSDRGYYYPTSTIVGMKNEYSFPSTFDTLVEAVRWIYDNNTFAYSNTLLYLDDFIQHVYVGTNWLNKREIFNITDLNFSDPEVSNDIDNYLTVPDYTEYFIDLHDLVTDLVNTTDLINIFLNHIVDINGVLVHDDDLIRVTTSIYDLLRETNPVLPVNLNDIADYTDNSYLERVKEEAKRGGNALAVFVAFWHNCDAELIYVMFGAGITVLVGAFVGKWGHS